MALLAGIPAVMGAIGAGAGVTGAGVTAATSIAAGTAITTMGATAAAGGIAAYGAYQQGQAQKNLMNYQRDAANLQAQQTADVAKANISGVQTQASLQSEMLGREQARVSGSQRASEGAQGIGGSVTSADIAKDTFTKQQMDQMTLQYNANVKTWDITNQANQRIWALKSGATQYGMGAENAAYAGDIGAGLTLLNTASQIGTEGYYLSR